MPFVIELCPKDLRPNIEWRGVPFITGVLTTVIQLSHRRRRLFLDLFFSEEHARSQDDHRHQGGERSLSAMWCARSIFGSLASVGDAVPVWTYCAAILLSIAGSAGGHGARGA